MNLKQFFKPTLAKIILAILLEASIYLSIIGCWLLGPAPKFYCPLTTIQSVPFLYLALALKIQSQTLVFITSLIYSYILAVIIVNLINFIKNKITK